MWDLATRIGIWLADQPGGVTEWIVTGSVIVMTGFVIAGLYVLPLPPRLRWNFAERAGEHPVASSRNDRSRIWLPLVYALTCLAISASALSFEIAFRTSQEGRSAIRRAEAEGRDHASQQQQQGSRRARRGYTATISLSLLIVPGVWGVVAAPQARAWDFEFREMKARKARAAAARAAKQAEKDAAVERALARQAEAGRNGFDVLD